MSFLKIIDDKCKENRIENKITSDNEDYRYYEEIIPVDYKSTIKFQCLKKIKGKIKILMCFDSTKVYLSDLDIVNIIIQMGTESIQSFIDDLIKVYKGEGINFKFKIDGKELQGKALSYKESDKKLKLYSDNEIHINDFIFILNLIITKDYLATQQLKVNNKDLMKITLCKYICLLKFYGLNDTEIKETLQEEGYPIEKDLNDVFSSYDDLKKINNIFNKNKKFEKHILI